MDLDRVRAMTGAELGALQLERLQASVRHAQAGNPHSAHSFAEAGVDAGALTGLDALARLPFTTKADLRAAYPFGFLAVPPERVARLHASSGTTGQATVVGYTRADIETWSGLVARSIAAAGGAAGMKVHVAYGYGLFTGGLGAHYGAEALGCTVIPVSGGQTARQVQLIRDFAPEIIMVTPSYMLAILDEFRAQGLDPRSTALRIGIFGAEPWGEGVRQEIEAAFGIRALDIYGLSEVMGPGVAQEFAGGEGGPTIWEDHFYPEIIDPATGAPLPDGAEGELVLTSLTREAMPVIRYRTGDRTRLLPGDGCVMRRIARISGRTDDMLIVRGVNVFPVQIEEVVLKVEGLAPHYVIEVSRPDRLDEVRLRVEARPDSDAAARRAAAAELARLTKETVGISVTVEVGDPGSIERSAGKARHVIDHRKAR